MPGILPCSLVVLWLGHSKLEEPGNGQTNDIAALGVFHNPVNHNHFSSSTCRVSEAWAYVISLDVHYFDVYNGSVRFCFLGERQPHTAELRNCCCSPAVKVYLVGLVTPQRYCQHWADGRVCILHAQREICLAR